VCHCTKSQRVALIWRLARQFKSEIIPYLFETIFLLNDITSRSRIVSELKNQLLTSATTYYGISAFNRRGSALVEAGLPRETRCFRARHYMTVHVMVLGPNTGFGSGQMRGNSFRTDGVKRTADDQRFAKRSL